MVCSMLTSLKSLLFICCTLNMINQMYFLYKTIFFFILNGIKLKLIHRKTEVFTHDLHTICHSFRPEHFKSLLNYRFLKLFHVLYHYLSFTHKHLCSALCISYFFFRKTIKYFFPFKIQLLIIQYLLCNTQRH